jgi:hypothetical protein
LNPAGEPARGIFYAGSDGLPTGGKPFGMKSGGRGDHTRVYIANTRRSAQFSLGAGET